MATNTYLTLTIGPIVDTLLTARYTRELWASSYLFSYIVRETISKATADGIQPEAVLLPFKPIGKEDEYCYGAGLYPDRIYIQTVDPDTDAVRLTNAVNNTLNFISQKAAGKYKYKHKAGSREEEAETYVSEAEFLQYLKDFLRINVLQNTLAEGENIVTTITPYLDASEQYAQLLPVERFDLPSPLRLFLDQVNGSFLFRDGFDKYALRKDTAEAAKLIPAKPKLRFDSLIQIATRELGRLSAESNSIYSDLLQKALNGIDEEKGEENLVGDLKKAFPKHFRAYHKYVAIVHVDGDNVGKIVGKVASNPANLRAFSQKLRDFALKATEVVDNYGGAPIYAGGDDMLFFAPIASLNRSDRSYQTIFDLFAELDELFDAELVDYARNLRVHEVLENGEPVMDENLLPSLSYGVSINFYKYPLYEARNASYGKLHEVKQDEAHHKNGIGVKFLKHSGHAIEFTLHKLNKASCRAFLDLLKSEMSEEKFLNSFTYKLEDHRVLLTQAGGDAFLLEHFFRNNFNEIWGKHEPFFKRLIPFIMALHAESSADEKDLNKKELGWLQLLYAALRFIHFLKSKDTSDEQ